MKLREGLSFLSDRLVLVALATALVAPACHSVDVAPWPYTTQTANTPPTEDGASDGGTSGDGASDDASTQGANDAGGIQANYGPAPLRCDGGLCDTDNFSLCNVADSPAESRAVRPLSVLFVVGGMALARVRSGRKGRRSS
jgi:hypothetical protein